MDTRIDWKVHLDSFGMRCLVKVYLDKGKTK